MPLIMTVELVFFIKIPTAAVNVVVVGICVDLEITSWQNTIVVPVVPNTRVDS